MVTRIRTSVDLTTSLFFEDRRTRVLERSRLIKSVPNKSAHNTGMVIKG